MTQSPPKKEIQIPIVIMIVALFGISIGVGFAAMMMTAVLFLILVGGPEWGPTLMLFGSPVVGFLMGVGSLMVMGGHAAWWSGGKRPFSPSYFIIWILCWVIGLMILAFPFIYSLIDYGYYSPENSLLWTIPLSLSMSLILASIFNWHTLTKN